MTTTTKVIAHRFEGFDDGITITCYRCSCEFKIPAELYRARKVDHHSFWCPLGHEQHFAEGKTEAERLRLRLEEAQRETTFWRDREKAAQRQLSASKGQLTKLRNRVTRGVCPDSTCKRSFTNVHEHIKTCHPELIELLAVDT